ncbi:MAG TPA: hypothetical protein DEA08_02330 [Planctomycetes bacterium]|nr:hypothetical protein [Planctomycetota bacterium]
MSDAEIQRLQRAWGASPADQQLLSRLIAAHRRVGDVPPPALLDAQLTPAAMVRSESSLEVYSEAPDGRSELVGTTPGEVSVSPARFWYVRPRPVRVTDDVLSELVANQAPGVSLASGKVDPEQLRSLSTLEGLRYLSLESASAVDDACLEAVGELRSLEALNLSGRKKFGRTGLQELAKLPYLVHLNLRHNSQLGDAEFAGLARLGGLTRLCLEAVETKGAALAHLSGLGELRFLSLRDCKKISGKGLRQLPTLPELQGLDLGGCEGITNPGLIALEGLGSLEVLHLPGVYKRRALEHLRGLGNLRTLSLGVDKEDAAESLAELRQLQSLDLYGDLGSGWGQLAASLAHLSVLRAAGIQREGVATLPSFKSLRDLHLSDSRSPCLDTEVLRPLTQLTSLTSLSLSLKSVKNPTLELLSGLTSLQALRISAYGRMMTKVEFEPLATLLSLRSLELRRLSASGKAIRCLRSLGIEGLQLGYGCVGRGCFAELAHWSKLRSLSVCFESSRRDRNATPDDLRKLVQLPDLCELHLTTYGVESEDAEAIAQLPGLRRVSLHCMGGPPFKKAAVRRIQQALPRCVVTTKTGY